MKLYNCRVSGLGTWNNADALHVSPGKKRYHCSKISLGKGAAHKDSLEGLGLNDPQEMDSTVAFLVANKG